MGRRSCWIAALLVVLSAGVAQAEKPGKGKAGKPSEAQVDDDARPKPITVALLAGYGIALDVPFDLNPFGVGFGVRGGYNLDAVYLGARFMFFLGDSEQLEGVEISSNSITIGLEAGYALGLIGEALVLRPELGLGLFIASSETMNGLGTGQEAPTDDSSEDVYIAPGFALLANVSERVFVGLDAQVPIIFADEILLELTLLATAGMRF